MKLRLMRVAQVLEKSGHLGKEAESEVYEMGDASCQFGVVFVQETIDWILGITVEEEYGVLSVARQVSLSFVGVVAFPTSMFLPLRSPYPWHF